MHKIQKFQTSGKIVNPTTQYTDWLGKSFSVDSFGGNAKAAQRAATSSNMQNFVAPAVGLIDPAIQLLGGKQADNISGGEQLFSNGTDLALDLAMKSGNVGLMVGAGALKGLDYLNRYAGAKTEEQGTKGLDTGAYTSQLNPNAGKKHTLLGTWAGKVKKSNYLTKSYDKTNLLAGNAAYQNKQNMLSAQNTFGDIAASNEQKLYGGVRTNILASKKGGTINPAQLRNLAKKVKKSDIPEIIIDSTVDEDLPLFQEGGKLNVIPEGALHARKHDLPKEIADSVTNKGIPVITFNEGGDITQHAEIERDEIIFHKETTNALEDYFKKYKDASDDEKNKLAIECGKFLVSEILENTDDRTGLLNTIE